MKKYDEYKDSGVAWIREVPKHWEVGKLKHCSHIVLGKMLMTSPPKGSEGSYTLEKYLKSKNVGWLQLFLEEDNIDEMWFNQYEKSIYKLQENDIVMNEGGDIGKVSCWRGTDFDCYIQNSINKITADYNRVDAGFLCYWLYNLSSLGYFWSIVSQISIAHLTKEKLSNSPVVLPPITEQVAIATYLDTHCAKIDNLISIQQKRIALLQELKQSVITHAVTKGLNPNVEMKRSGVEWIGDVPKHWKVCKLKSYCSLKGRIGWNGLRSEEFEKESYAYLVTGQDFVSSDIEWGKCYQINKIRYDEDPCIQLENGDLLITKDGTIGKIAKVSNMDKPACLNSGIFVLKQKSHNQFEQGYLYWALFSNLLKDFNSYTSTGTTILHLYQNIFENMPLVVPSKKEQQEISNYLDSKTMRIDTSISNAQHQIDLLQEYKQSLITEVVTGKRKVTDN
ncbi:restriction endonuclease subunit S [Prevotella jejuni]